MAGVRDYIIFMRLPILLFMAVSAICLIAKDAAPAADRPVLIRGSNNIFTWSSPDGWRVQSTNAGVDLESPDGLSSAHCAILTPTPGYQTPSGFLEFVLRQMSWLTDVKVGSETALPSVEDPFGRWVFSEFEVTAKRNGTPIRARWVIGTINAFGSFRACFSGYQTRADRFEKDQQWLLPLARGIVLVDASRAGGIDKVRLPRPQPLDNSGLIESWRKKGISEDRISQARREGMMGYETVVRKGTGEPMDMPLEKYDPKLGGYPDPKNPNEILIKPTQL